MRDNFFHTFVLFMTGQIPDQLSLGTLRWYTVVLYWLLFIGGITVAVINWDGQPHRLRPPQPILRRADCQRAGLLHAVILVDAGAKFGGDALE